MKKNEIKNREFETRMMHCGLMAEIIAYRSCNDMDVRFETGHIRHGVRYSDFKKEKLAEFSNEEKEQCVSEKSVPCIAEWTQRSQITHGVQISVWNLKTLPKEQEWLMIPLKKVP